MQDEMGGEETLDIAKCLNNLGFVCLLRKEFEEGLKFLNKALKILT